MQSLWRRMEGPTWLVAGAIYTGWFLLTLHFRALPIWLAAPMGAWLIAWHGSLQHETVHGHPTRNVRLNTLVGIPPLALWMPYPAYRCIHLIHHETPALTSPLRDPESFYFTGDQWNALGRPMQMMLLWNNTLLGRLVLGPAITVTRHWFREIRRLAGGDFGNARDLVVHVVGVAAVLYWVGAVAGMPIWIYVLAMVYPGLSLTLLRSFLEHRPTPREAHRSAIVETGLLMRLLFLNNNLHALHHARPGLPWFDLARVYRETREAVLAENGNYVFPGYGAVARRFLVHPKDMPVVAEQL